MLNTIFAAFCLFNPPENWEMADPKTPSQQAICGFVDQSHCGFCPSIHLTYEITSCDIEQYLEIASKNAKSKRHRWRRMGTLQTQSGAAHLIEIELNHTLGKVSLLQAILPKEGEMHILTAGALKKELARCAPLFREAFQSMKVTGDLVSLAKNPKEMLHYWQKREEDLESFQKAVLKEDALGPVYPIQLMRFK